MSFLEFYVLGYFVQLGIFFLINRIPRRQLVVLDAVPLSGALGFSLFSWLGVSSVLCMVFVNYVGFLLITIVATETAQKGIEKISGIITNAKPGEKWKHFKIYFENKRS